MAMITSAAHPPWPLDCPIADLKAAGLPAPSKVRFKLFTLDHRLVRGQLGRLSPADEARVREGLAKLLALAAEGRPTRAGPRKGARRGRPALCSVTDGEPAGTGRAQGATCASGGPCQVCLWVWLLLT